MRAAMWPSAGGQRYGAPWQAWARGELPSHPSAASHDGGDLPVAQTAPGWSNWGTPHEPTFLSARAGGHSTTGHLALRASQLENQPQAPPPPNHAHGSLSAVAGLPSGLGVVGTTMVPSTPSLLWPVGGTPNAGSYAHAAAKLAPAAVGGPPAFRTPQGSAQPLLPPPQFSHFALGTPRTPWEDAVTHGSRSGWGGNSDVAFDARANVIGEVSFDDHARLTAGERDRDPRGARRQPVEELLRSEEEEDSGSPEAPPLGTMPKASNRHVFAAMAIPPPPESVDRGGAGDGRVRAAMPSSVAPSIDAVTNEKKRQRLSAILLGTGDGRDACGGHVGTLRGKRKRDGANRTFLTSNRRDAAGRAAGSPGYDARTLFVPRSYMSSLTSTMQQFWRIKSAHADCLVFFKLGTHCVVSDNCNIAWTGPARARPPHSGPQAADAYTGLRSRRVSHRRQILRALR